LAISDTTAQRYALHDPDVRLMLQVRDDNATAFEELMLRYQDRLVTVLEHLVGSRDTAEDLAQDVFLRVYRSRKTYVPGAKFSTWLFTIANNIASNSRRNKSRRRELVLDDSPDSSQAVPGLSQLAVAASGAMPTRQMDKEELRSSIRVAVSKLNERQRMAVLLNKFENMSYEEIAETMNLTTKAIKSLLSRARSNLRLILEPYLAEGTAINNSGPFEVTNSEADFDEA
jgi:RNA polymerase sigma-70 factor, ECF subfamily